jgi:hypothetical protein
VNLPTLSQIARTFLGSSLFFMAKGSAQSSEINTPRSVLGTLLLIVTMDCCDEVVPRLHVQLQIASIRSGEQS